MSKTHDKEWNLIRSHLFFKMEEDLWKKWLDTVIWCVDGRFKITMGKDSTVQGVRDMLYKTK
jgi:hypothetical protein